MCWLSTWLFHALLWESILLIGNQVFFFIFSFVLPRDGFCYFYFVLIMFILLIIIIIIKILSLRIIDVRKNLQFMYLKKKKKLCSGNVPEWFRFHLPNFVEPCLGVKIFLFLINFCPTFAFGRRFRTNAYSLICFLMAVI